MSLLDLNIENNHNYIYLSNHVRHVETKIEYFTSRVIEFRYCAFIHRTIIFVSIKNFIVFVLSIYIYIQHLLFIRLKFLNILSIIRYSLNFIRNSDMFGLRRKIILVVQYGVYFFFYFRNIYFTR